MIFFLEPCFCNFLISHFFGHVGLLIALKVDKVLYFVCMCACVHAHARARVCVFARSPVE